MAKLDIKKDKIQIKLSKLEKILSLNFKPIEFPIKNIKNIILNPSKLKYPLFKASGVRIFNLLIIGIFFSVKNNKKEFWCVYPNKDIVTFELTNEKYNKIVISLDKRDLNKITKILKLFEKR